MAGTLEADGLALPPATEEEPKEEPRRRRKGLLLLILLGLFLILIGIAVWYLIFRQPIVPIIPVIPQSGLPSYSQSAYGVDHPVGIAATPTGDRLYVAETEGSRLVRMLDGSGNVIGTLAPDASTGTDHVPAFVAIDPLTTEVYVTDRPTGAIYVYNSDGIFQRTFALAKPIAGWQPIGIAFDRAGNLFVSDLSAPTPRVEMIDRSANVVRTFGENDQLNFPNGLAVDATGNVYVADSNNGRLMVYGPSGNVAAQVGRGAGEGNLGLPRSVAIDGDGRVFVVDSTGQMVSVFRVVSGDQRRLDYLGSFGTQGTGDGTFSFPNGVAVDTRGHVYIADTSNNRVQVWSY